MEFGCRDFDWFEIDLADCGKIEQGRLNFKLILILVVAFLHCHDLVHYMKVWLTLR
jgi:hypothetical protein